MNQAPFLNAAAAEAALLAPVCPDDEAEYRRAMFAAMMAMKDDVTWLKVNMTALVGNGQPGRVGKLEGEVSRHTRFIAALSGGLILSGFVIGWLISIANAAAK